MMLWLRLSATFHEHPKMLAVRAAAGSRADSAELGWYRLLMAAKRYGRWSFASEAHLAHVAGSYYRFVPLYREARLLDDLTIHDGDSYNANKTDAERKAEQRERDRESREGVTNGRDIARDGLVTLQTDRETDKTDKERDTARAGHDPWDDPEHEAVTWLAKHGIALQPHSGYYRNLATMVEQHGVNAVVGMFDRLASAGTKDGDIKGYVFAAKDALDQQTRPNLTALAKEDRADEVGRSHQRELDRTQAYLRELRGDPA